MEIYKKKLKSNIWKIYLYEFLYSLMFFTPIIVLFYQDNWLSLKQIMTIQSITSIVWVITEVPSWYFADNFGRKTSLMITGIFASLSMLIFWLWNNFYYFFIASLFWVLAGVFISGADSAFVYDTLKELNEEKSYKKVWWNIFFYYSIGTAIASIIWWIIWWMNFRYPFFVILPFYILLIPLAISLHEPRKYKIIIWNDNIYGLLKIIKISVFQNKKLVQLLIYSAVIVSVIDISYYLYQPYFKLSWLDIIYFGLVFASFNIIQALSAKYSHIIENKIGQNFSLILLFILTSMAYILMWNIIFIFSFVFAFLFQFVSGFSQIIISDYIHKLTKSNIRATVFSIKNLIAKFLYVILAPIIWYLADFYTLSQVFIIIWIIILVVWFIFLLQFFILNRKK